MGRPAHILILTADARQRTAWAAALAESKCLVSTEVSDGSTSNSPDVIVLAASHAGSPLTVFPQALARGEIGLVAVGLETPADVSLPPDCTARELRLACLLLAEIVRLRRDRSKSRRAQTALAHLAYSDPLTGLANRRAWDDQLARRLADGEKSLCVAIIDLDHFKRINDSRGHGIGDACLQDVAQRLTAAVRRGDFVARLGGDEFALLLAGIEPQAAAATVDRIRRAIATRAIPQLAGDAVTASAGWVHLSHPAALGCSGEELVRRADRVLREAKNQGRDRTAPPPDAENGVTGT